MSEHQKLYSYRVDKEEAEKQGKRLKQTMRLPGVGDIPISVAEVNSAYVSLTGRQALALLRILERNRTALEREAEREREFGRGPGAHAAEVPQKIRKGDPRLGKRAITYGDHTIDGKVTATLRNRSKSRSASVFRKSGGLEQPWHACMLMMWIFSNRCLFRGPQCSPLSDVGSAVTICRSGSIRDTRLRVTAHRARKRFFGGGYNHSALFSNRPRIVSWRVVLQSASIFWLGTRVKTT